MASEIERCVAEQKQCADYIIGDWEYKQGAWDGLFDWLIEELLLRERAGNWVD